MTATRLLQPSHRPGGSVPTARSGGRRHPWRFRESVRAAAGERSYVFAVARLAPTRRRVRQRRHATTPSPLPHAGSAPAAQGSDRTASASAPGELFALDYDLLLYDVTSTYFEGLAARNALAARATAGITGRTASRCALRWSLPGATSAASSDRTRPRPCCSTASP